MSKIEELNKKYKEVTEEINELKADGSLAKLISLSSELDENFDEVLDPLREKYIDVELLEMYEDDKKRYEEEKEALISDLTNEELLKRLDEEDMRMYINWYECYICELQRELNELKYCGEE